MKKYISYILVLFMFFSFIGCSKKKVEEVKEKDNFDIKMASVTVDNYVKLIKNENYELGNKLLSETVKTEQASLTKNDLKILGHKILEMSESDGEGIFKVEIVKCNLNKPETLITESQMTVIKEGMEYKIDKIANSVKKEIFYKNKMLRMRKEKEVETNLVIDMQGLPKYAYAKDDKAKMKIQIVPKSEFGVAEFGYEGNKIAITTYDANTFIGILTLDDTMVTQGNDEQKGEGEGKGQKEGAPGAILKEKPIGKQLLACDVLNNSDVEIMMFSMDEKLLAVQYKTRDNSKRCIRIYNVGSGELIPTMFEEEYPLNKVQVLLQEFQKEKMLFSIIPKTEADKDNEYVGNWEMDLKEFKLKKIVK
ncbi:hypothetical protein [Clostridium ganghwense]|uniref:Head-tail adaptor protein n=1 Tax=Clostridium ganghwense TaxID=312089 RepID=A0ABT4CSF8_9CLOT|nr:hypothetical protein [Clostridium ganghwense]MCY6371990.1 hypothetical protein [Clostridium ganghwense]